MKVLAIDPGVTVGFSTNEFRGMQVDNSWQKRIDGHMSLLWKYLWNLVPDVVVYEQFDHRQRNKVNYIAVEQIGVIKLYAQMYDKKLVAQTASYGKKFFDNKKLRHLELYVPGADYSHAMDALRHRLRYEMDTGAFDLTQLKGLD